MNARPGRHNVRDVQPRVTHEEAESGIVRHVRRILDRLRYFVERMLVRGPQYQLLVVAALIGLLSITGGAIVLWGTGDFDSFGTAVWWAFLRLTDPGYLGDDAGNLRRLVSAVLTVAGYVVFLGALVAIMTQWLMATMRRLESGVTPVAASNHIAVLGWTAHTATLVADLLASEERLRRFLHRRGARRIRIVVLSEQVTSRLTQELRDRTGPLWNPHQITLRSGSCLRPDHLERVDVLHASAVLIPAQDAGGDPAELVDTRTIKALLSVSSQRGRASERSLPIAVAELRDARKIPVARQAYSGDVELLASDATISRLIVQTVRHRGLSAIYNELLTHSEGNEVYIRDATGYEGASFEDVVGTLPFGLLLGVVRPEGRTFRPLLNPAPGTTIQPGDRFVVIARSFEDSRPGEKSEPVERRASGAIPTSRSAHRSVLLLGWSHQVPALLAEFAGYSGESFTIVNASLVPGEERRERASRYAGESGRLPASFVDADYANLQELTALEPWKFDNIVLVGSDRLGSQEDADARTIGGYLLVGQLLREHGASPGVLVELLDPENDELLRDRGGEVIVSPMILNHMLTQIALRRELRAVFEELIGIGGAEIAFRRLESFGQDRYDGTFSGLQRLVWSWGETLLGVMAGNERGAREPDINPAHESRWRLGGRDVLVTLATST